MAFSLTLLSGCMCRVYVHNLCARKLERNRDDSVADVRGVGQALAQALNGNGFKTAEVVARATLDDLVKVTSIGAARAAILIAVAKEAVAITSAAKPFTSRTPIHEHPARRAPVRSSIAAKKAAAERKIKAARKFEEERIAAELVAAAAKAKKKAKAKAKAEKAARKKTEMEAAFSKAK